MLAPLITEWRRIGSSLNRGATSCLLDAAHAFRKHYGRKMQWEEGGDRLPGLLLETIPGFAPVEWLAWRIDASVWVGESPFDLCIQLAELPDRLQRFRSLQADAVHELTVNNPVVIYSAGAAVLNLLSRRSPSNPPIFIAEGRPGNEGVALAQQLLKRGIIARLLTDTGIINRIEEDVILLLGTDRITRTGFHHKIGTCPLIDAANRTGAQVIALADPLKRNPPDPWTRSSVRNFRRQYPGNPELQLEGALLENVPYREPVIQIFLGDKPFHPGDDTEWEAAGKIAMQMLGWPT
ncbi:MAG: hypothetical protein OEM52_03550 [bacterium]|nr:hypothetical protein [bacterium]